MENHAFLIGGTLMKAILMTLTGALTYLALSLMLTSYDHLSTHQKINVAIVEEFLSRYAENKLPADEFYNYTFNLATSGGLEGEAVLEGDMTSPEYGKAVKSPLEWIQHGGFSADEPQLEASFRHFYDPTQPEGERYLKDLLDDFYVRWAKTNPKTDHVEWAISHIDNGFNYQTGKDYVRTALEIGDKKSSDKYMALAWRAFGQTLHLIADMGIASHVRDDAHPGVGSGAVGYKWSYDSDPYEEIIYAHTVKNGVAMFLTGQVDTKVTSFVHEAKTTKSIAEFLATYTNENFFSHETISGAGVKPIIDPDDPYPLPKLEDCTYDSPSYSYVKNIGGNNVIMCRDHSYAYYLTGSRGDPYIDEYSALSQATALMPQIREAGVHALRCFIPKIEVKITSLENGTIKGMVKHHVNQEYPTEIKYNGTVKIKESRFFGLIDEVECVNGVFEDEIKLTGFNPETAQLYAEIEFGYVYVKSDPYVKSADPEWNSVNINFANILCTWLTIYETHQSERTFTYGYGTKLEGSFSGGVFSAEVDRTHSSGEGREKIMAELHVDMKTKTITHGTVNVETNGVKLLFQFSDLEASLWDYRNGSFEMHGNAVCEHFTILTWTATDINSTREVIHHTCVENHEKWVLDSILTIEFSTE